MRVLCLTFGDSNTASTFYRIHQYIAPLSAYDISVTAVPVRQFREWQQLGSYDTVLLQKALLPISQLQELRNRTSRFLYDVDDAIWHPHTRRHFMLTRLRQSLRLRTVFRLADHCTAANDLLAAYVRRFTSRVSVIPMALDETVWYPRAESTKVQKLRIGWSGHPVNLPYLAQIEPALAAAQRRFPEADIAIFSGSDPGFDRLRCTYIAFKSGIEAEITRTFDIGLLPLPNGKFAEGKSPIKGLQYMATAIPTVLGPVGAAAQLIPHDQAGLHAGDASQWEAALVRLLSDGALRIRLGQRARAIFEQNYALSRTVHRVAAVLRGRDA